MAVLSECRDIRPSLSHHKSYHGPKTILQSPLPEYPSSPSILNPSFPRDLDPAIPFDPPNTHMSTLPMPHYEAYTIRPDDLVSSEERWSSPPMKSIPATQEDLHTEVISQRQSGRTACRELEDCHGPKRQYIDRLIRERNTCTSVGHFEVAQLRLERVPRDSVKASNRNSGRNYHARDYKHRDPTKPRQKTVYMHIILQYMENPNRSPVPPAPGNSARCNASVDDSYHGGRQHTLKEDSLISSIHPDNQPSVLPVNVQRPGLARRYPYTARNEQSFPVSSGLYISRGTQTSSPEHSGLHSDYYSGDNNDISTPVITPVGSIGATSTDVEQELPNSSHSSGDEINSSENFPAAPEYVDELAEKDSTSANGYEKPPWFQNLQPGLFLLRLQI